MIPNYDAPMGIASLAIIAIGLVVTWAGYIKGVRWTWLVMFVIVWVWAFPVLMLPLHPWSLANMDVLAPALASALKESGMARSAMGVVLAFLLMVLALVLPLKTFILGRGGWPKQVQPVAQSCSLTLRHLRCGRRNAAAFKDKAALPAWRSAMRIRLDRVFMSSVLLTLSLLALVPHNLRFASTWRVLSLEVTSRLWTGNYLMPIGFASLAIVLVGLIVIWAGYIKTELWSWFVMFVIVWVFAFPVHVLPLLLHWLRSPESINWSEWFSDAVSGPGIARDSAICPADFLLMVVALFLPVRSFFRRPSDTQEPPLPAATGHPGTIE